MRYASEAAIKRQYNHVKLTQTTDGATAKPFKVKKPIAKVSKNMLESLKKYRRLRDKYFELNPVCEFPGCSSKRITLHHKRGRIGAFLTDKRWFCSLCPKHHAWVNENHAEAFKMGLVHSRLEKLQA